VTSDDGLLTIDIPAGAPPESVDLTATARGKDDLPPELLGLEVRSAFYSLEPGGLVFAVPVTITRRVSFEDLGLDLATDGLPVLTLALREESGRWEWLDAQTLTADGDTILVTGEASGTGTVFAFGGTAFTKVVPVDAGIVDVGESTTVSATLVFPDGAADPPTLGATFQPLVPGDWVTIGAGAGPEDGTLSQDFLCVAEGSGFVGVSYEVHNVGADSALFRQLSLGPASTLARIGTILTCVSAGSPAPTSSRVPETPLPM
jgi:hypothetical protein